MTAYDHKIQNLGFQGFVNTVFDRVATRYDLMNDLMSGGVHRIWKDAAINWLAPSKSSASLLIDVAGGTGDITKRFLKAAGPGSRSIITDINHSMMDEGRDKHPEFAGKVQFVQANAESLPYKDNTSDFYTISFGIRNVANKQNALNEAFRVLKPGGRFLCLEFSRVQVPLFDKVYEVYSDAVVPPLGRVVAGDAEPYRYLVDSIRAFPDQKKFAGMIEKAGFSRVQYRNLSGGIAALHSGLKL